MSIIRLAFPFNWTNKKEAQKQTSKLLIARSWFRIISCIIAGLRIISIAFFRKLKVNNKIELRLSLELIYVSRADSTVGVISAKFRITFASISKVLFLLKLFRGYFLFLLPFFRKEYFSNHLSAVLQNLYELSLHMKKKNNYVTGHTDFAKNTFIAKMSSTKLK